MRDILELLPRIHEVSPSCPEPTAIRHLRDAAIEFCRRTRIWRDYDEFPLRGARCDGIGTVSEADIFEISHATVKDATGIVADLIPVTVDWLDRERTGWRDDEGTPVYITQFGPGTVRVTPAPDSASALTLRLELILVPSITAQRLIDPLVDTYGQAIADGALGRILATPGDLAQPALAPVHAAAFEAALGRWGAQIPLGQQRVRRRTKPSTFF